MLLIAPSSIFAEYYCPTKQFVKAGPARQAEPHSFGIALENFWQGLPRRATPVLKKNKSQKCAYIEYKLDSIKCMYLNNSMSMSK